MRNDNVKCTQSVLVKVQDLKKYFDVSPSLLTRVVKENLGRCLRQWTEFPLKFAEARH